MSNIGKWNAPSSVVTVHSTSLNSLADDTMSAASSAIANQTNLDMYVDIELVLASLSPVAGAHILIFIAEAIDGTNYPADAAATMRLQTQQILTIFSLGITAATAQRTVSRNIIIPPGTFKLYVDNQAGVALGATLNTLKILPYNTNLNG